MSGQGILSILITQIEMARRAGIGTNQYAYTGWPDGLFDRSIYFLIISLVRYVLDYERCFLLIIQANDNVLTQTKR